MLERVRCLVLVVLEKGCCGQNVKGKRGNGKACTLKHLHFSLGNVLVVPLRLDVVQVANELLE